MSTEAAHPRASDFVLRDALMLVGTLGGAYGISQFLRNSIGVIAPNLATELDLSASEIGLLASVFFFSFAAAQIPLGVALDRYGPRRCMLVCAVIAIVGALLFAWAPSPGWLITARVLMGLGASCYFMAPLALYARRFPPDRFATVAGFQYGLGTLGTLLATAPFAWAVAAIGWRACFVVVSAAMLAAGILIAVVIRNDAPAQGAEKPSLRESFIGMMAATRVRSFWPLFAMHFITYSSFVIVVGLWGGPYLTHIYGYSLTERGNMLLVAVVFQVIGALLWGPTDRWFKSYKVPVMTGALMTAAVMATGALVGEFSPVGLFAWFVAIGLTTGYLPVMIAHGKSLFPADLVGRGITLLNIATMGGVFVSQSVTGFVIDLFPAAGERYALDAYRSVFALQAGIILLGCLAYFKAYDPRSRSGALGIGQ
jgi:MFS family permease